MCTSDSYRRFSAPTAGDDAVVARVLVALGLSWSTAELKRHRHTAQLLVRREQHPIEILADELLRHRRLTGDEIGALLSISLGIVPSFGAPVWVS